MCKLPSLQSPRGHLTGTRLLGAYLTTDEVRHLHSQAITGKSSQACYERQGKMKCNPRMPRRGTQQQCVGGVSKKDPSKETG